MILIITNTEDATADYLCQEFLANVPHFRVNTDALPAGMEVSLVNDEIRLLHPGGEIEPHRVTGVWYRRPGRIVSPVKSSDVAIEQFIVEEWTEALESFLETIPPRLWVNHPRANVRASRKLPQLQVAKKVGLRPPASLLTMSSCEARDFMQQHDASISKPLGSALLKRQRGSSFVYTSEIAPGSLAPNARFSSPMLFQEKIVKKADVRITVIDNFMVAVAIFNLDARGNQTLDVRVGMMSAAKYARINIPPDVAEGIVALLNHYNLRFGALDFAIDHSGRWIFFEINPNGQWAWLDIDAGLDFGRHLAQHLMGENKWVM